jgi:hypothetical protein
MTNNDWKNLILSVGDSHLTPRPCSPIEIAQLIEKAKNSGYTTKEIAERCHFGATMVSKFANLLKVSKDFWHLIDWGGDDEGLISFTAAQMVAQHNENLQKEILAAKLKYGFNKDEISFLGQRIKNSGMTIEQCIEESSRKRHGPPILFWLLMGAFSENAQKVIVNLSQLERDNILRDFFNKNFPDKKIVAKSKLTGFSLVINDSELFKELNNNKEIIETKINEFICQTKQ